MIKHIFRINVYGRGYTLYSGYALSSYKEFPLDIQSDCISKNYLSAQKRIDTLLDTQTARWCFCSSNNYVDCRPVITYGCLLHVPDDTGRMGVSFIHGIESDEEFRGDQVVVSIAHLFSQKTIDKISLLIARVAKGTVHSGELIEFLTTHFNTKLNYPPRPLYSINPIKEIRQDCGEASIITWLAMMISHSDIPAPWEIYEEYSTQDKALSILSSLPIAKDKYLLSEYICSIHYMSQNKLTVTEDIGRDPIIVKPSSISGSERIRPGKNPKLNWRKLLNHLKQDYLKIALIFILIIMTLSIIGLTIQVSSLQEKSWALFSQRVINEISCLK
jgi:hypothetical protein